MPAMCLAAVVTLLGAVTYLGPGRSAYQGDPADSPLQASLKNGAEGTTPTPPQPGTIVVFAGATLLTGRDMGERQHAPPARC